MARKALMPRGPIEPLPFQITVKQQDAFTWTAIRSTSAKATGLLHFGGAMLLLEWAELRSTQSVGLHGIISEDDTLPLELLEVPIHWIGEVRLLHPAISPRLELRGRRLDAFEGVPGAMPGLLMLRVARRHRRLAKVMAQAIEAARLDPTLLAESERPQLSGDRWTPLPE